MKKILLYLCCSFCIATQLFAQQIQNKPNIVFIFSDDHAYQAISAYNSRLAKLAPTPNIDRIANDGMLFNKCYVTNSICTPARASVLTGTHSHINGVRILSDSLDTKQVTFPMVLHQNGYQTAIVGKWHLKSDPQGFDYWDILPGQGQYYNPEFINSKGQYRVEGYATNIITDKAIDWLAKRDESKPFLLMINHKAPHRPWQKGPERLSLYEDTTFPEPDNLFDNYKNRGDAAKTQEMEISKFMRIGIDLKVYTEKGEGVGFYKRLNPEQRKAWDEVYAPIKRDFLKSNLEGDALTKWKYQRYMRDYLAVVRSVDDNVGVVLDYLEKNHLTENTIIVYSSDQGFYLGEHGWFDKRFMYEESFRTPLLIKWPKVIKAGTVNNDLVSNLDFAQTFIDVAGGKAPKAMQGLSLSPLLKGGEPKDWRKSLYYHYYDFPSEHQVQPHEGVATKQYKLIHFYNINQWELYDLDKDPHEMMNEYDNPTYSNVVKMMKLELEKLKHQYKAENSTDYKNSK